MRLAEIASLLSMELIGDPDCDITAVATLEKAKIGNIAFLSNKKYKKYLSRTKASAVILNRELVNECPTASLITDNPYLVYAKVAKLLQEKHESPPGVHPSAVVDASAKIDRSASVGPCAIVESNARIFSGVIIGAGSYIGHNCVIRESSHLLARVTICDDCTIGKRVIIYPGAVIGSDGFGLAKDGEKWIKIPQLGAVCVGDDVEIGANTTIDRGAIEDTVIENGVKLDNQIQIAHNVYIGEHTAIAGCVGIAGSAKIGKRCTIGGAAVVLGHLTLADDVHVTAMTLVTKSISNAGIYSSGTPLDTNKNWRKNCARFRQLDKITRRLDRLEKQIQKN